MNNIDYFNLMIANPEKINDGSSKEKLVIENINNELTLANKSLLDIIDKFSQNLNDNTILDSSVHQTDLDSMIALLSVDGMNLSPFSQYLLVHNISHSIFQSLENEMKYEVLSELVPKYFADRHIKYKQLGYSDIVFQVMSDNYSHKRQSKTGIDKILDYLSVYKFAKIDSLGSLFNYELSYLLPDKGDKDLFFELLNSKSIEFKFSKLKSGKLPDLVLFINDKILIIEHKTMRELGGGQDKQIAEIIDFIRYSEKDSNISYLTFLDGILANSINKRAKSKTLRQYNDILEVLNDNRNNFFVNTFSFKKLIDDLINRK